MAAGATFATLPKHWAIRLHIADAMALSMLRLIPGLSVCESEQSIWARGGTMNEALERELRKLPGERFWLTEDDKLQAQGKRIPRGSLPEGHWQPIAQWISPAIQSAALPGSAPGKISLRWQPSTKSQDPRVLITPLESLRSWATRAAEIRLRPLRFALSTNGRTVIHGEPLPPIRGQRLVEADGVAWPAGFAPSPAIDPATLGQLLQLSNDDLVILDPDGAYSLIQATEFVPLTRSAVRSSLSEAGT